MFANVALVGGSSMLESWLAKSWSLRCLLMWAFHLNLLGVFRKAATKEFRCRGYDLMVGSGWVFMAALAIPELYDTRRQLGSCDIESLLFLVAKRKGVPPT